MIFSHLFHTFSHLKTRCESALLSIILDNFNHIFTPSHLFTIKSYLVENSGSGTALGEFVKKGVRCERKPSILYGVKAKRLHTSFFKCENRCENEA